MSFELAKATWLQYLDKKLDYFRIPSFVAQNALLKQSFSPSAFAAGECQRSSAAAADADDPGDDEEDFEGAGRLYNVERVVVKRRLRDFHDSGRAKNRKDPGTVAEALKLASELINQEDSADACSPAELAFMKSAPVIGQDEAREGLD